MGMQRISLQPFNDKEALALFTEILGASRAGREQDDLLALARLLGYLPLAISIVAGRLVYDEERTAVSLLAQLQENQPQPVPQSSKNEERASSDARPHLRMRTPQNHKAEVLVPQNFQISTLLSTILQRLWANIYQGFLFSTCLKTQPSS